MSSRPSTFPLTKQGAGRLFSTEELIRMPAPQWQIHGIIPNGGLVGLYAPPGVGKTFLAIDMAMCVATGRPWMGHSVVPGFVLYISAEGGTGIGKRVAAWLHEHKVNPKRLPIAWQTEAVPITPESGGMDLLMERIAEIGTQPDLIIIDTLARCFDGDENTQEDMGRFVKGVDLLRVTFDSTVLIVHHTRLDGERERGNTAFRGAADAMLKLDRDEGEIFLGCTKQKDAEEFKPIPLELKVVDQFDSCVLAVPPHVQDRAGKRTKALLYLETEGPLTWDEWHEATGLAKTSFNRAYLELKKEGKVFKEKGKWRVK